MSWIAEFSTNGGSSYGRNSLVFETESEAKSHALELESRWLAVTNWRTVETDEAHGYRWIDGKAVRTIDVRAFEREIEALGDLNRSD